MLSFKKKGENHTDLIDLNGARIEKVDDKSSFANNGFTIYSDKGDKSQGKTFYAKSVQERDKWVRYMQAAIAGERIKSGRRVASPRQPQQQKKIKKIVRGSADKKYKAMESITMRADVTSRRMEKIINNISVLHDRSGGSSKEELEKKQEQIFDIEQNIKFLESQLKIQNEFIITLQKKFKDEVQTHKSKAVNEKESLVKATKSELQQTTAEIQQKKAEMEKWKNNFSKQMNLAHDDFAGFQSDLDDLASQKKELVKHVSLAFDNMKEYIKELE